MQLTIILVVLVTLGLVLLTVMLTVVQVPDPGRGWDRRWNGAPNLAYSNSNLSVARQVTAPNAAWQSARSVFGRDTGKWYWEVSVVNGDSDPDAALHDQGAVGFIEGNASPAGNIGNSASGIAGVSWGYGGFNTYDFYQWDCQPSTVTDAALLTGNTYMLAMDVDNGQVWGGLNGTWFNDGDPATGLSPAGTRSSGATPGRMYAGVSMLTGPITSLTLTANFGDAPFAFEAPTDFLPLGHI
jgi:hypothetical protein